jgi:hypothetical protein
VPLQYPATVKARPYNPAYPHIWAAYPLSQSDPALFTSWFTPILAQLEASGVVLAGLELGNEFNWAPFNGDFPVPGEVNVFGDADLYSNSEAEVIAAGYRAYMPSLQALTQMQIRDASALNQATPVISAGLSNPGAPRTGGVAADGVAVDAVSIDATLNYLRDLWIGYNRRQLWPSRCRCAKRDKARRVTPVTGILPAAEPADEAPIEAAVEPRAPMSRRSSLQPHRAVIPTRKLPQNPDTE